MRVMMNGAVFLTALVCVGCADQPLQPGSADAHGAVQRAAEYSGEDLFLAIFYGQGEAATLLPTLWNDCDTP